jgi:hypothetical protein
MFVVAGCTGVTMQLAAFAFPWSALPVAQAVNLPSPTANLLPTDAPMMAPPATEIPVDTATPTPRPTPTAELFVYAYGPYYFPLEINPLTGLPVDDPASLERRPMVIKVTNFPRSVRPQQGLSLADHVYEYYIGDSMSRFIGVFYGRDATSVGPIRSARLFDEHVMRMYKGIFVFGWADDPILEFLTAPDIKNLLLVERPDNCPPLCRAEPKSAYNNLFADTSQIGPYLERRGTHNDRQNLNGLRFELAVPKSGNPGEVFYLQYSIVSYHYWQYDPDSGRYLRFQETNDAPYGVERQYAPLIDSLTGKQLGADNVVVLRVPHEFFMQSNSTEILDQPLEGSGTGYAFRNGLVYPITWSHDAPNQLIRMYLPNGVSYPLKPGNVWYEMIGETSEFSLSEEGGYRFDFRIP